MLSLLSFRCYGHRSPRTGCPTILQHAESAVRAGGLNHNGSKLKFSRTYVAGGGVGTAPTNVVRLSNLPTDLTAEALAKILVRSRMMARAPWNGGGSRWLNGWLPRRSTVRGRLRPTCSATRMAPSLASSCAGIAATTPRLVPSISSARL